MTEAWAWGQAAEHLVGHRSTSPWDDAGRRPSHADKRRAWRRELLGNEIQAVLRPGLLIDSTVVRAHQHAAGARRKKNRSGPSGRRGDRRSAGAAAGSA